LLPLTQKSPADFSGAGSTSEHLRSSESQRLLNHGFQDFEIFYLYKKMMLSATSVCGREPKTAFKAVLRDGLTVTLPKASAPCSRRA